MKHFCLTLLTIICLLSTTSCSVRISNFDQYQKAFLPNSEKTSNKKNKAKVVIFDFDTGRKYYTKHSIGKIVALEVANTLTRKKTVELIDRKAAQKLHREIALAEMNNAASSYKGPRIADYAIIGTITKSGYQKGVSGSLKIYALPSMKIMENIKFSGLLSDGSDAIDNIAPQLYTFFSRKAYILEKRVLENKAIFKINYGYKDGLNTKSKFNIIRETRYNDNSTHEAKTDEIVIASGKSSNLINSDSSWIILDRKKYNDKVRAGDTVILKHEQGFFEKITKFCKNITLFIAEDLM